MLANLPPTRVSTRLPCLQTMGDCRVDRRGWYSKRMRLTKRETAILQKVLAQVTPERYRCYENAQRASLYSEGKMLYHEGTFGGRLAHAWNSINGKIIDISSRNAIVVSQKAYRLFVSHGTYTSGRSGAQFGFQKSRCMELDRRADWRCLEAC